MDRWRRAKQAAPGHACEDLCAGRGREPQRTGRKRQHQPHAQQVFPRGQVRRLQGQFWFRQSFPGQRWHDDRQRRMGTPRHASRRRANLLSGQQPAADTRWPGRDVCQHREQRQQHCRRLGIGAGSRPRWRDDLPSQLQAGPMERRRGCQTPLSEQRQHHRRGQHAAVVGCVAHGLGEPGSPQDLRRKVGPQRRRRDRTALEPDRKRCCQH